MSIAHEKCNAKKYVNGKRCIHLIYDIGNSGDGGGERDCNGKESGRNSQPVVSDEESIAVSVFVLFWLSLNQIEIAI